MNNEDIELNVLAFFCALGEASGRDAEIQRNSQNSENPYTYTTMQRLEESDLRCRIEFCEWFLVKSQEDEHFLGCIIWTDGAKYGKKTKCSSAVIVTFGMILYFYMKFFEGVVIKFVFISTIICFRDMTSSTVY